MSELDRIFDAFFRNSIGFDHLPRFLTRTGSTFPPYDVVKSGENTFEIQLALVGFGSEDVEVTQTDGHLIIESEGDSSDGNENDEYQYRGIAKRAFKLTFALSEHVEVLGADFTNGLLIIRLEKIVPEVERKSIPIGTGGLLEHKS